MRVCNSPSFLGGSGKASCCKSEGAIHVRLRALNAGYELPPAWLRLTIVLAAARRRISCWGNRIALEHKTEEVVAAVRNGDIGCGHARYESALWLIAQHCDELGAIIGLAAQ